MASTKKLSNYTHARYCCDISDLTPDERRAMASYINKKNR